MRFRGVQAVLIDVHDLFEAGHGGGSEGWKARYVYTYIVMTYASAASVIGSGGSTTNPNLALHRPRTVTRALCLGQKKHLEHVKYVRHSCDSDATLVFLEGKNSKGGFV
jgi:hypothetical protein